MAAFVFGCNDILYLQISSLEARNPLRNQTDFGKKNIQCIVTLGKL